MIRVVDEAPGTPGTPDRVQAATLRRLRRIVALAQRDRDARDAPVHDLVGLTSEIPTGAAVTIDFTAAAELGQPLVVLRIPVAPPPGRDGVGTPTAPSVPTVPDASGAPGAPGGLTFPREPATRVAWQALTRRECEVAALVAAGLANHEIAARLCVTLGTAKDHVHHLLVKTGFPNRAGLAAAWAGHAAPRHTHT